VPVTAVPVTHHCRTCAATVHPGAAHCSQCGHPPLSGTNFCFRCASPSNAMIDPCRTCGARLINASAPPPSYAPPPPQYQQPQYQQPIYQPPPTYQSVYVGAPMYAAPGYTAPQKSKATAAMLCFCLGGLGIHRFYTGQAGLGVALLLQTLILTPLTLGLWGIVVLVWIVVDFILILAGSVKDGQGRPLV
jgi:TM2 domain-containing membrane protein YozV